MLPRPVSQAISPVIGPFNSPNYQDDSGIHFTRLLHGTTSGATQTHFVGPTKVGVSTGIEYRDPDPFHKGASIVGSIRISSLTSLVVNSTITCVLY